MAACTPSAVSGRTPPSPFTTRETVLIDTLARRATSTMVARPCRDDNVVIALSVTDTGPDVNCRDAGMGVGASRHVAGALLGTEQLDLGDGRLLPRPTVELEPDVLVPMT